MLVSRHFSSLGGRGEAPAMESP